MGEDGSVEDTGHEVVIIFEWQDKWVVALAKARTSEQDRGKWIGVRGRMDLWINYKLKGAA